MNWPRYKFSKECEPELQEFFKAVAEQESSSCPPSNIKKLWEKFLPVDEHLQQKINAYKISVSTDVIDITNSDDEKIKVQDKVTTAAMGADEDFVLPDQSFSQLTESKSRISTTITADLVDEIRDFLETEPFLSADIIKQFGTEYSQEQLRDIFSLFASDLNSECTLKLWQSIITVGNTETNNVATYFLQYVLVQNVLNKHDPSITIMLVQVLDTFPDEATAVLLKILLETENSIELKKLRDNLNALTDNHKNALLRAFENSCTKLELHHLGTALVLINTRTRIEDLTKLMELMSSVCKDFASEKAYGKLLLEVIQAVGGSIVHCEDQLRHIIATHRSIFKAQIVKIFESSLQDHRIFSESLRY